MPLQQVTRSSSQASPSGPASAEPAHELSSKTESDWNVDSGLPPIRWLHDRCSIREAQFGHKAANLSRAVARGFNVPIGACVSADLAYCIASGKDRQRYRALLEPFVLELLERSHSRRLIVRSSSRHEDSCGKLLAGVFDTFASNQSVDDVVFSIERIVNGSRRHPLPLYLNRPADTLEEQHMSILVQDQLEAGIAGIAHVTTDQILVEFGRGRLSDMLSGQVGCSRAVFDISSKRLEHERHGPFDETDLATLRHVLSCADMEGLAKTFALPIVEFLISNRRLVVLQVTSTTHATDGVCLPLEYKIGRKAAAMWFFQEEKLFTKNLEVFDPGTPIETIARVLRRDKRAMVPCLTVRFSLGGSIGLPRGFADGADEALVFIRAHRRVRYATIVHDYIDVTRSFEILLDKDVSLVEHVPGMWESNNELHPDVILLSASQCRVYRFRKPRATVFGVGKSAGTSFPLSDSDIHELVAYLRSVREVVLSSAPTREALPVAIHAVWDESSKSFQCLNLRRGYGITLPSAIDERGGFHLIRGLQDIEDWDGSTPLRVALRTSRGTEASLIELAQRLGKTGVPVAVDFGLLSHPAMILREYGNRIYPSYLAPACFSSSEYECWSFPLDKADDAVRRILRERPAKRDDVYHIVVDRAPIGEEHFLAVSKRRSPSVKDTCEIARVVAIFESVTREKDPFFFERGRGTFCTSGFTGAHDHFHVIGGLDNTLTFEAIVDILNVGGEGRFDTVEDAYRYAPGAGEYCLFGSRSSGFAVSKNRTAPAQLLRRAARMRQ